MSPSLLLFCTFGFIHIQAVYMQEEFVWREAENGMVYSTGCDYSGFDYWVLPSNSSECSQECYKNPNCTHFSWTESNHGTCFLKKHVVEGTRPVEADKNSLCGYRGPGKIPDWHSLAYDQLRWARGCDFDYNNLKSMKMAPKDCFLECLRQSDCSHFSWSWYSNGTCWLKQNFPADSEPVLMNQEVICGFKTKRKFEFDENHNLISTSCDFVGNFFLVEPTTTFLSCSTLCMEHTRCTHFSYSDEGGGQCFLKNGVSDGSRPAFNRILPHCGFKYTSPEKNPTNCQVFKETKGNSCKVDVEVTVNKKDLL